MIGLEFLSEYMKDYQNEYILIGGNACALNFNNEGAEFRATVDLDIVLIIESTEDDFFRHLINYLVENDYVGKKFNGPNGEMTGGSAYRFTLPEEKTGNEHPTQIELFSKKPDYFDPEKVKNDRLHITPIETAMGISNFSAILLDDELYEFIQKSKTTIQGISTVGLECLFGLKSIAWHSNQRLFDENKDIDPKNIFKHPNDMVQIVSIIESQVTKYPKKIFDSLQISKEQFVEGSIRKQLFLTQNMSIESTIKYIEDYVTPE
ncbi:hypothetical protein AB6880_00065 [Rahnella inusitata]|uniref:hypothetical protein n=1 Tax=Rahnella inusitata TaxID=58169 RepID=UPI0039BE5F61